MIGFRVEVARDHEGWHGYIYRDDEHVANVYRLDGDAGPADARAGVIEAAKAKVAQIQAAESEGYPVGYTESVTL